MREPDPYSQQIYQTLALLRTFGLLALQLGLNRNPDFTHQVSSLGPPFRYDYHVTSSVSPVLSHKFFYTAHDSTIYLVFACPATSTSSSRQSNGTPQPICEFQVGIPLNCRIRLIQIFPNPR